ncbi:hypothetical protein IFT64_02270 [Oxalobacteraceae sp. CFBP 8753]|nr:hypothetical protein [Oxalobacteraceae sp. CFBP 8753]
MNRLRAWLLAVLALGLSSQAQAGPEAMCERLVQTISRERAQTLLQFVARGEAVQAASAIKAGANPNARYRNNGRTLLMEAAAKPANEVMLDLLWQAGASPFLVDQLGRTVMQTADASNQAWLASKIKALPAPTSAVEQGWLANVKARQRSILCEQFDRYRRFSSGVGGGVALLQSALKGTVPVDPAIVKLLAESGLPLEPISVYQPRPLALAAALPAPDALDSLLEAGADPNLIDLLGRSALTHAILHHRPVNVARLIDAQAAVNPAMASIQPLPIAIEQEDADIVALLLQRGVSVGQRAVDGAAPVAVAVKTGNIAITTQLLKHQADPNGRDSTSRPALILAARAGAHAMISLLLANQADATLSGPDGRSALDIMEAQQPEVSAVPDQVQPVESMPDQSPVALELTVESPVRPDPLHAEDLEGDSNGGYLLAIDPQITALVRATQQDIRRQVDTWFAPDDVANGLEKEIGVLEQRIAAQDETLRNKTSELARVQSLRATQVQEGIAQRAELHRLTQSLDARMAQVVSVVGRLRSELEVMRILRARLSSVETDVEQLAEDFQLGRSAPFAMRHELMRKQADTRSERDAELAKVDDDMRDSKARAALEGEELARPVAQAERDLNALLQQRFGLAGEAASALKAAEIKLAEHLRECDNPPEDVARSCHNPKNCAEMKSRDAARAARNIAAARTDARDPHIAALQVVLEREQGWARDYLRALELRQEREAAAARAAQTEIERSYASGLLERELVIKNLELSYSDRRRLLLLDAQTIVGDLESKFGKEHQKLYQAAAQVKTSLTSTSQDNANKALLGWTEIAALHQEYAGDDTKLPPGLRRIAELVGDLNAQWSPFRVNLDGAGMVGQRIATADAQRKAAAQRIAALTQSLQTVAAQRQDKQRDLEELLQRRRDGAGDGTERGRLERAMEELVALYEQLLREAFRPSTMHSLTGAEVLARETALRQDISKVTGKSFTNPFMEAIDRLPEPGAAVGIQLNDLPDTPPVRFAALTAEQSRNLAAFWFAKIDFDDDNWQGVNDAASARRRMGRVFSQAIINYAKFDRADFASAPLPGQSAYRFIVRDNSYWIRSDGSLRSYLERDQNAMFSYRFVTPENSSNGKTLRDAYQKYVANVAAAYPTMSAGKQDLVRAVESAFRALDRDDRVHKAAELSWRLVSAADLALSAYDPVGAYYGLYKVLCKISAWDEGKGVLDAQEIIADIVFLFPARKFFARPTRPSLAEYGESVRETLITDLTTSILFHYDDLQARARQTGQAVGLGTQSAVFDEIMQLRATLADSRWMSEASTADGPSAASRWSQKVKPANVESGNLILTRVTDKPAVYVNGPVSKAVREKLERCLGVPLLVQPARTKPQGPLVFGVARNSENASTCIVFSEANPPLT